MLLDIYVIVSSFSFAVSQLVRNNGKTHRKKNRFESVKTTVSSTFLLKFKFQGYRCKSGIAIS